MNQSENINELAGSLAKAQGEMQAAIKDSVNPFFKSKYADLGSIWDACRPVLSKNGLCVVQATEIQGEKTILVTTLIHSSGQWMKSYLPLNPSKNDSQGMGAAITYLRRYSLSALVGVVCDEDDDGETAMGRGKVAETKPCKAALQAKPVVVSEPVKCVEIPTINEAQLKNFLDKLSKTDDEFKKNIDKMCKERNLLSFAYISVPLYESFIRGIENNLKLKAEKGGEI